MARSTILSNINSDLANNDLGLIDAIHVRRNMLELANNALMAEDANLISSLIMMGAKTFNLTSETNGSKTAFDLNNSPHNIELLDGAMCLVYREGVPQFLGVDFTLSGNTITFVVAPEASSNVYGWAIGPTSLVSVESHTHTLSQITDAGDAAGKNVGQTAGTVAAGDDSRIIGAKQKNDPANTIVTVTNSSSTTWDAQNGLTEVAILTATGNRTITAPSNPVDGQKVIFVHTASGGTRTPTFQTSNGAFNLRGKSITSTASGDSDYYGFIYNYSDDRWNLIAVDKEI